MPESRIESLAEWRRPPGEKGARFRGPLPDAAHRSSRRCAVCDAVVVVAARKTIVLGHDQGPRVWARCPRCRSFFASDTYDARVEVRHIRTRAWGQRDAGVKLGEAKSRLFDSVFRVLRRAAPLDGNLLDVGCSYGTFLERARKNGYTVRGVDIVPEAVDHVRGLGIPCDEAASVADVDVPPNSQDVVSVLDCNCYWPDHRRELRAIWTRLRPGGLLVMRVVDTSWLVAIGMRLAGVLPEAGRKVCERAVYDHRVSVPARSMLELVTQEGFTVLHASVRDAIPFRRNAPAIALAYSVGVVVWGLARRNVAPGLLLLARKDGEPVGSRAGAAPESDRRAGAHA